MPAVGAWTTVDPTTAALAATETDRETPMTPPTLPGPEA